MIGIKDKIRKKDINPCGLCGKVISDKSPVNDLCQECFSKCTSMASVLNYLQTTSIANLNVIQSNYGNTNHSEPQGVTDYPIDNTESVSSPYLVRRKTEEKIAITLPLMKIGSSSDLSDYSIPDNRTLSRIHAIIQLEDGNFYLSDNNSKNGTKHNGVQLKPDEKVKLKDSDEFNLSSEHFVFHD